LVSLHSYYFVHFLISLVSSLPEFEIPDSEVWLLCNLFVVKTS
jgi:hypothetical protein